RIAPRSFFSRAARSIGQHGNLQQSAHRFAHSRPAQRDLLRTLLYRALPGLVDAIVAGNVRVANALGSGLIETAAIMPFLPGLARQLLGEKLKLPSVATWGCGRTYALDWVLDHLDS